MPTRDFPDTDPATASRLGDDGYEFELTDLETARRVLDEESVSQFDVARVDSPEHWKRMRRAPEPTDAALSGVAIDWLLALPPNVRPERVAERFPRIAHALATAWSDPAVIQEVFAKLLHSERRNRQGFPPDVQEELVVLKDWLDGLSAWDQPF